jgi:drug/metabolite transporter (DMT)-like permease
MIKANVFTNLIPVFTGLFSFFILGETFTPLKIIGILLVMSGVVLSQSQKIGQIVINKFKK